MKSIVIVFALLLVLVHPQCTSNCKTCTGTTCSACNDNYIFDANVCKDCIAGCKTCPTLTTCSTCKDGFFLVTPANTACTACSSNCKTCTSNTVCTVCNTGYFLSNNACSQCSTNCDTCTSNTACTNCTVGYFLNNGACSACNANCRTCINATHCSNCTDRYYLANNVCWTCSTGSLTCNSSVASLTCASGYYKQGQRCIPCLPNCATCTSRTVCTACASGFSLASGACTVACTTGCATCTATSSTACTSCVAGYYFNTNACPACATGCKTCNSAVQCTSCLDGYLHDSAANTCTACTLANCKTCSPVGTCTACLNDKFTTLTAEAITACTNCPTNCLTCTSASACTTCADGFFGATCDTACAANCLSCSAANVCTVCNDGYYPSVAGVCTGCPAGCSKCASATQCTQCSSGNYLANKLCNACPNNCATCLSATVCLTCNGGRVWDQQSNQVSTYLLNNNFCSGCPNGCDTCEQNTDGKPKCLACIASYTLDATTNRCIKCRPPCTTCVAGQPRNCTACIAPLTATNGACVNNCNFDNCQACTTTNNVATCTACKSGFFLMNAVCYPCQANCGACTETAGFFTNIISTFWNYALRTVYNITTAQVPASNSLPTYANNLDFAAMTTIQKQGWTEALAIAYMFNSSYPDNAAYFASLKSHIDFYTANENKTRAELDVLIVARASSITGKTWTLQQYKATLKNALALASTCSSCITGYYSNPTAGSFPVCLPCKAGCSACSSATTCIACKSGFFLSSPDCVACTPPCATCLGTATTCTSCVSPNLLVGSTCIVCNDPCSQCSSGTPSVCTQCKAPFNTIPLANGTCYRCAQDSCSSCYLTNTSVCLACKGQYTLQNGVCVNCPANCTGCVQTASGLTCIACNYGYELSTTGVCNKCSNNCIQCQLGVCFQCNPGTYLNQVNNTCMNCRKGCAKCTSFDTCTELQSGVALINGNPISCRPGCKTCSDPNTCTQCNSRFFLSAANCVACEFGCEACTSATVCTKCLLGYNLANQDCTACTGNCSTCNAGNAAQCLTCKRGFNLVAASNLCMTQCQTGCIRCDVTDTTKCLQCSQGHALTSTGRCVKCVSGCGGSCDPKNITTCVSCPDSFYLANNQCLRCPIGCAICYAGGQCYSCTPGYKLGQNAAGQITCLQICKAPCSTCSLGVCSACQFGFTLTNGKCVADIACNPKCDTCLIGTYKSATNSTCYICPENCASCDATNCFNCLDGYFLNGTACSACSAKCLTCSTQNSCLECAPGYLKQIVSMNWGIADAVFNDNCTACSPNCKTCAVQADRCTSCPDGSRPKGYRCQGLFRVAYQFEIDIPFATFIENMQSQTLIETISNKTGISLEDNFVEKLYEGSTIIVGSLSTGSASQAQSVQSSLGNSLTGFPVLSSSSSVMYGDSIYVPPKDQPASTTNNPNVGLIVGLTVGLTALVVIVILLVYFFKCRKQENVSLRKQDSSNIQLK